MSEGGRCAAGAVGKRVAYNCRVHYRDLAICVAEKDALIARLRAENEELIKAITPLSAEVQSLTLILSTAPLPHDRMLSRRWANLNRSVMDVIARAAKKEQP